VLSVRQIRRKIRTVRNIHKITDAMRRVAAAKLRRVQDRVSAARPYADKLREIMGRLGGVAGEVEHPLLEVRPTKKVVYVVIGSDRGLCGSYNGNLCRFALAQIEACEHEKKLVTVNKKAGDFFRRKPYEVLRAFCGISDETTHLDMSEFAGYLRGLYESGEADEVNVCYTRFVSAVVQQPTLVRFLPFVREEDEQEAPGEPEELEYIFEPDAKTILLELIPAYVDTQVYHMVLESTASEHGARMMSMTNATENAAEMIADLTLTYNKARQSGITTELLEVVAGANALADR
jgi:F-type H+-transporting ATPase subunit gamma